MRIGEVINLNQDDFDAGDGALIIRHAKSIRPVSFRCTRRPSRRYGAILLTAIVDGFRRGAPRSSSRQPLPDFSTATFNGPSGDWNAKPGSLRAPELVDHESDDLRHSFAVHTLIDAYREGVDTQQRLTVLSTYLGHVDPAGTYWYLSASPELLGKAADHLERSGGAKP